MFLENYFLNDGCKEMESTKIYWAKKVDLNN